MRFGSRLALVGALLLAGCNELQSQFQGPARVELSGVKEGACATLTAAGQSQTKCQDHTYRFYNVSGKVPLEVRVEWRGVEVQGFQGEVELSPGRTAKVQVERKTLSLAVEALWASSGAVYEAWVDADFAFGTTAYPDAPPPGLERTSLVYRGRPLMTVPTAPRVVVRVLDGTAEARRVVESPVDRGTVRVEAPTYAPIRLTPDGVSAQVGCVVALLGEAEAARACSPPFVLSVVPPDGEYRTVVVRGLKADGLPFQEGTVTARSGESRTVALERKRVRVELTAPGLTADTSAYGEVWLRPEDQEGVPLYGDQPPAGYEGYRLADRALVVNGAATLSVPTGRAVLFRLVGQSRTTEGVVDRVDADRRVVLP